MLLSPFLADSQRILCPAAKVREALENDGKKSQGLLCWEGKPRAGKKTGKTTVRPLHAWRIKRIQNRRATARGKKIRRNDKRIFGLV
jgi:hypothetical protein